MSVSIEKLSTGVPGFDTLTYGGIPKGRATLVVGRSGTGKTVLALQMATHLARSGRNVIVFAVEETVPDLVTTAESLGLRAEALMTAGHLTIADLMPPLEGPTVISGDYDLQGLVQRVSQAVRSAKADVVILDSVTSSVLSACTRTRK
jgi:circadian clock protein KaiC